MTCSFFRHQACAGLCVWANAFLALAQTSTPTSAAIPATASEGAPKIQFASTVYDFGKVSDGEIVRMNFVFTNVGSQTLEIKEVRPSCGCTAVGALARQIAPGKSGVIPLQLNTANMSGQIAKFVAVTCNDPAQSFINLQIKGAIWKAIDVAPSFVVFHVAQDASSKEVRTVKITSNVEQPIELSLPQVNTPAFRVEITTVRPGKEFDLHITPVMPFPNGNKIQAATIKINTSSTNLPVINIAALAIAIKTTHTNMAVLNAQYIQHLPPAPAQ